MPIADVSERSLADLLSLGGRRAVVTGGGRGVGRATVLRLAEAGAAVLIADLDPAAARDTAAVATSLHGAPVLVEDGDVGDPGRVRELADRAAQQLGGIDVWVNNAGIYGPTPLFESPDDLFDRYVAVNLRGVFVGAREAARHMRAGGCGGVIVNVASAAAIRSGRADSEPYSATKAGVVGLTRALAVTLAPSRIRVLGIAPTLTRTPGVEAMLNHAEGMDEIIAERAAHVPLGRPGVADDVARVIVFCASDLSTFMTGSTLLVDGGELAH
jgi:NAD(P)-dependent dehydrogenase (short-subunit alcohol dehydrogenase family)